MSIKYKTIRNFHEICKLVLPTFRRKIVFISFPDMSDNAWSLFKYYYDKSTEHTLIWLVKDSDFSVLSKINDYPRVKVFKRHSIKGWFNYLTARVIFHTHGIFSFDTIKADNTKRIVFNLWHGMPIKQVGILDSKYKNLKQILDRKSHYSIATSEFYRDIIASSFAIPKDCVFNVGLPRNDVFIESPDLKKKTRIFDKVSVSKEKTLVVWLPTYRESMVGDIRSDSNYKSFIDEVGLKFIRDLDFIANSNNIEIIIKLHPMDILNLEIGSLNIGFKAIKIIDAESWRELNIDLYDLLATSQLLISDLSSVIIDVLPSSVKVATTSPDFSSYNRDVIPDIYELWKEIPKIRQARDLLDILSKPNDIPSQVITKFNSSQLSKRSCESIYEIVERRVY